MTPKDSQDKPNRLYAHWLDGEWQRIAYPVAVEGPYQTLQGIAEGALKLHALFGTRIVISDVQLTDSEVVVRLFANPEFRAYLRKDRDFLTLVAQPRQETSDVRLATATRGLARAFQPGWMTSLPRIPVDVILRFGETILSADKLNTTRCVSDPSKGPGRIIASFPEHKEFLEGILHGICHFVKKTGGPTDTPSSSPRAYTQLIEDALKSPGLPDYDHDVLEGVWKSVRTWVRDESKLFMRSSLIKAMELKEPNRNKWPTEWHRVWNTVVHAWNSNVCDTVAARGASIAPLPHAVVPYRGQIHDVAGPFTLEGEVLRKRHIGRYPVFTLNPSTLGWLTVGDAVCKVRRERARFQRALWKGDLQEIEDASAELIGALLPILARHSRPDLPHWIWLVMHIIGISLGMSQIERAAVAGEAVSFLRTQARKGLVLNTLHGFKRDLISSFSGSQKR